MTKSSCGVSPVVASAILVAITVVGGVLIFSIVRDFSSGAADFVVVDVGVIAAGDTAAISLTVRNVGSIAIDSFEVVFPEILLDKTESENASGGSGTPEDPYIITTVQQLQAINNNLSAHYALGCDIDASETRNWNNGVGFYPIGYPYSSFSGSLDGRGYKIINLFINRSNLSNPYNTNIGLFGVLSSSSSVMNIGLENVEVRGSLYVGAVAGKNYGRVYNAYATGTVSGTNVGLLVGRSYSPGLLENCFTQGSVNGGNSAGGLAGGNDSGSLISNCYSSAAVYGSSYIGGLVGYNAGGSVTYSYSVGGVSGSNNVGGLVGIKTSGSVDIANFWDTQTSGRSTSAMGTGKTTAEMKTLSTFSGAGWSIVLVGEFDPNSPSTWFIDNGISYPKLWYEFEKPSGPLTLHFGILAPGQITTFWAQIAYALVPGQRYSVVVRALDSAGNVIGTRTATVRVSS